MTEQRAYYHWNAGELAEPSAAACRMEQDLRDFLRVNPRAEVILIGHSMGAATALRTLARFSAGEGCFYLLSLDPVDRSLLPERPACVCWWGNAYVVHSRSARDFIPAMGGRWNACAGADVNLCFDGRLPHSGGFLPLHDDAAALLMARPNGGASSLLMELLRRLRSTEE